ncbi:sensor histidine kinase [uncultured Lacinutrix sp.]|uniref:tetratricopeptide repeat-containing sensor histidine kinase n=1 Tax=uncultured Lacinutrix sp. TaxID=574032 RepID=UPI00263A3AED|nr:sensor histidine kinase [uncultured Lacinutrix sp.]
MKQLFILICIFSFYFSFAQKEKSNIELDSIYAYREYSKNTNSSFNKRIVYAKKAIERSKNYGEDSTIIKSQKALSSIYLNQLNTEKLKSVNFEIIKIASKIKDSAALANANFILGYAYDEESKQDSAYFYYSKAVKQYEALGDTKDYINVLSNMSYIQQSERDYIGAEINTVRALKTLEKLPNNEENNFAKWDKYNLLGIISGELKNFDKALEYYNLSISVLEDEPNAYYYILYSKNNIGSIYRRKGDYPSAIKIFNTLLEDDSLYANDPESYANIKANLAYSKFLNNDFVSEEIGEMFSEAFKISSVMEDEIGIMGTSTYYAEFLKEIDQVDSAKKYVNLAYKIAKNTKTNSFVFKTLITKSELEKDSSDIFLNKYIKLNDSLITAERSMRNKFARIDYETDVIIQEKEAISKQNLWLVITSIVLLLSILLLYIIKTQREKNKELELAQQQQEANEEIYNLMLSQQDKMDEARAVEKKRISQEIHDGILGRLFGTRLSLDSLNMVNTKEAIISRENYIKDLMEIEKDIRKVSHDLNTDFISHASFSDMINTLVETQCTAYGLDYKTKMNHDIKWENLTNKTKIHIYRIIQESLQNIYKHAKAKLVNIIVQQEDNLISLSIIDDGVGYDSSKQKEGIGLKNIKSRVSAIGGKQKINTQINKGTTINIEIPI